MMILDNTIDENGIFPLEFSGAMDSSLRDQNHAQSTHIWRLRARFSKTMCGPKP